MLSPSEKESSKFLEVFEDSESWTTANVHVPWFGQYEQDGRWHDIRIFNLQVEQGGPITGSGSDESGEYVMQGQVTYPNDVYFVKLYKSKESIEYSGRIDEGLIEGVWHKDNSKFRGDFFISMSVPPTWQGTKIKRGCQHKTAFSFNMYADYSGVYGVGRDEIGEFVIKGEMDTRCIKFVQCYHGQHEVRFLGHLEYVGDEKIIIGRYGQFEIEGNFELTLKIKNAKKDIYGAAAYMKKAQDIMMGGPISLHSREIISQTRLAGYTGPEKDNAYYTTITPNGWILHPGKCRFDYITQNGQGSLKGHSLNLNVPIKPAWGHLTESQRKKHPGLPDESNTSAHYQSKFSILAPSFHKKIKIPRDCTQIGELCTISNGEQTEDRMHCPPHESFPHPLQYFVDPYNTENSSYRKTDPRLHYNLQGAHGLPRANHYLIDMVHKRH